MVKNVYFILASILTIVLLNIFLISLVSAVLTTTITINDSDNFYSNVTGNNIIHLVVNVTNNDSAINISYANFSNFSTSCGTAGIVNFTKLSATIYNASCNVSNIANSSNFALGFIQTMFTQGNGLGSVNISIGNSSNIPPVILYNMTRPIIQGDLCDQFGTKTTDMSQLTNFSNVNFVIQIQTNFSCLTSYLFNGSNPGQFADTMLLNLTSINMSSQSIGVRLAQLQNAIIVNISSPKTFRPSRIFINSTAFSELNSTANITLFNIPFSSIPNVIGDDNSSVASSNITWISNGYSSLLGSNLGNLTFFVGHFSGYNATDNINPTITINSPTTNALTFSSFNVSVNGTGSEPSNITITIDGQTYSYVDNNTNTANCTNISSNKETFNCFKSFTSLSDGIHTINVTAYDYGGSSSPGNTNQTSKIITVDSVPSVDLLWQGDMLGTFNGSRSDNFAFACNISDGTGISNLTLFIWYNNQTPFYNSTTTLSGLYNSTSWGPSQPIDGLYLWNCLGRDTANNPSWSNEGNRSFKMDDTPSSIAIISPTNYQNISTRILTINVTSLDNFAINYTNISIINSTGSVVNFTTNFSFNGTFGVYLTVPNDDVYTIYATSWDGILSNNPNTTSITVTVDASNPYENPTTPVNSTYSNNPVQNFSAVLNDYMGIKNATLYVYNSSGNLTNKTTINFVPSVKQINLGTTVANLVDGVYTWFYNLFDWAGNGATIINSTLTIDTISPQLTITSPSNNQFLNSRLIAINYTTNDSIAFNNASIIIYDSNGSIINSTTSTSIINNRVNLTIPNDGVFSINITSYDNATNYNISSRLITVDTIFPTILIYSTRNNSFYMVNETIPIVFGSNEPGYKWYNNGTGNSTIYSTTLTNYTFMINYTAPGVYNITMYANDSANNLVSRTIFINVFNLSSLPNNTVISNSSTSQINVSSNITNIVIPFNQSDLNISVPYNLSNQTVNINFSRLIDNGSATVNSTFTLQRNDTSILYTVVIPNNTIISGDTNWTGSIQVPIVNISTFTGPTISGGTTNVNIVIDTGSDVELNFSNPVKVIIGNQSGKRAGWSRGSSSIIDINTTCNSGNTTNPTAPTNINQTTRECYINDGNDLVIWTLHFTSFAAYTYTVTPVSTGSTGSTGGSTGSYSSSPITMTYTLTLPEFAAGYTNQLTKGDRIKFTIKNDSHTIAMNSVSASEITVNVSSILQQKTIALGAVGKFDVNSDNIYDLSISFISYNSSTKKAKLTVQNINEPITPSQTPQITPTPAPSTKPATAPPTTPPTTSPTDNSAAEKKKQTNNMILTIVIIIVIIAIIIILYLIFRGTHKKKKRREYMMEALPTLSFY